jgi:thioredoxin
MISNTNRISCFITLLLLLVVTTSCSSSETKKTLPGKKGESLVTTISSVDQLNRVIAEAKDRLLMFDLYADWCMPCKILSPMLEEIAKEQKDNVTVYKINVDKNPEIAGAFGVSGIPFVVYVKNQKGVHAFTGVQSKDTYIRAINLLAKGDEERDITPNGKLVNGARHIQLSTAAAPGNIYVYRGETVKLIFDNIDFPYSLHIPQYKISENGEVGKKMEITFKAKDIGVFPMFCNGKCPTGDGAHYGKIVVMQYKSSGKAQFTELTAEQAKTFIDEKKPFILDVRTPNEYYSGYIEGAKLLPLQQLNERISELDAYKDKDVLVYCRSGNRSTVASQILIKNGFKKLYNLRPGIAGWQRAGFTVTK